MAFLMIRWILPVLILQFIRCSLTSFNFFHILDSSSFLYQTPYEINTIIRLLNNHNRTMNCAKFIPNTDSTTSVGKLLFTGKLTMTTLTMDYQPINLTGDLKYGNNLTERLKKGLNVDSDMYDYLYMALQSGTARLDFTNNTNDIDLDGTFLCPNVSTVSRISVKSKLDGIFNVTSSNVMVNRNNIRSFRVTKKSDKFLLVQTTSDSIIQLLNTELVTESNTNLIISKARLPNLIIDRSQVSYKYESCPNDVLDLIATSTSSSPPRTTTIVAASSNMKSSNFLFSFCLLFIFFILVVLFAGIQIAKLQESNNDIEMKVLHEAPFKSRLEIFYQKYPIGSVESRELDKVTALLPQAMIDHVLAISMIPPRVIADIDCFGDVLPVVEIGEIDESGTQMVKFTGGIESFNSIDSSNEHLECFYQVRIVTLEDNSPNLAIGFVTGLYPPFRLPGMCDKSIAFHCHDSTVRFCGESIPFPEIEIYEGDILGIGYYLQPPTEIDTNPDSTLKNVHFYLTFEMKRYEREYILENMDTTLIQPSIGSRSGCEVEVVFGLLHTAFAPESLH
ncbi:hypothetical protein BC833DRAFT_660864 [Globomyces pollinis-pini]|nr:hypothetical protein BC833DRAFT_660864 [Globomyces pollinis-pini]